MKVAPSGLHDRTSFVLDRVAGTRVVSVGLGGQTHDTSYSFNVTDAIDLSGTFSARLAAVAAHTTFIDISDAAIEAFRPQVPADYHNADITAPVDSWPTALAEVRCDHVVLGEVLEHLACPGAALRSLATLLDPGGALVVTVPNAFNLSVVAKLASRTENVHPEHVAYYSASTLTRLLAMSGLEAVEIGWYRTRPLHWRQALRNPLAYGSGWVAERMPQYARGLVAVARPAVA